MGIGIRIENLRKVYDTPPPSAARGGGFSFTPQRSSGPKEKKKKLEVVALEDVSFEIRPGEIFGLLGPEWRGQVHHHRDSDHPHAAHQRTSHHRRPRRVAGAGGGQAADRRGAPAAQPGFRPDGARDPTVSRRVFRPGHEGADAPRRRAAGEVQAHRPRRSHGPRLFRRHDAAPLDRPRHDARSRSAVPRRTFGRPRSADPPAALGDHPRLQSRRQDHRAHDALYGRGGRAVRPAGHHRPRPHHLRGHAGRAEIVDPRRLPAAPALRPRAR